LRWRDVQAKHLPAGVWHGLCYNGNLSDAPMSDEGRGSSKTAAVVVVAAALLVVLPFAFLGVPSGHDFEFHLSSWMEAVSQWEQGIVYPRWAGLAHFGYGEPRFIFYPPASWMLGALTGVIFPWAIAPAVFIWVALSLGGYSMYHLAREWLPPREAIAAAVLYAINPYHVVVVYWRSAYAELLADALFPLLVLWTWRARAEPRRAIVPLSLIMAGIWLGNAPAAVIATYSFALLTFFFAGWERNWRTLLYGAMAIVLTLGLATFYIIPAAWEQKWVNIAQVLSPGVRPEDNFLFTTIADPEHTVFNLLVSVVAGVEITILAVAVFITRERRREIGERWWALVILGAASAVLMFRITDVFWEQLPKLKFVQIPWRWLVPLNVAFAMMVTAALRRWSLRVLFLGFVVCGFVGLSSHILPPWWDHAQDIEEMHQGVVSGKGYEGTDEYVPVGGDAYELKEDAPKVEVMSREGVKVAGATINIERWRPEERTFTVDVSQPSELILRMFNYPAWRASVNGHVVETGTADVTGQMMIPVAAGSNRIVLRFIRTNDRLVGIITSVAFSFMILVLFWRSRLRRGIETVRNP